MENQFRIVRGFLDATASWPWSSYPAMIGIAISLEWLTTDWVLSQFGKQTKRVMEKYRQFVVEIPPRTEEIGILSPEFVSPEFAVP